jgi:hypothetical protein
MSELTMDDITPGTSWGCKFRVTTFCDDEGRPVSAPNLQLGQAHPGKPAQYESWGVIAKRDLENRRMIVVDAETLIDFVVEEADAWDYDRVEYVQEDQ